VPGVYREKECPTCAVKHRKKGMFCSKVCSNKGRDDEYKEKMRDRMLNTDEGQVRAWNLNFNEDTDAPIAPQIYREQPSLKRGQFTAGGDVWTVVDD
jgi:hypothetical protein